MRFRILITTAVIPLISGVPTSLLRREELPVDPSEEWPVTPLPSPPRPPIGSEYWFIQDRCRQLESSALHALYTAQIIEDMKIVMVSTTVATAGAAFYWFKRGMRLIKIGYAYKGASMFDPTLSPEAKAAYVAWIEEQVLEVEPVILDTKAVEKARKRNRLKPTYVDGEGNKVDHKTVFPDGEDLEEELAGEPLELSPTRKIYLAGKRKLTRAKRATILLGFLLIGVALIFGLTKNESTAVQDRFVETVSHVALMTEACQRMEDLAIKAEGAAEEIHGILKWQNMWIAFEPDFESAQDVAHSHVIASIANLPSESWPLVPPLPIQMINGSREQQQQYDRESDEWSDKYLLTLPRIKYGIERRMSEMHYNRTLEALQHLTNDNSTFSNDPEALEDLSRVFSYHISLPHYCERGRKTTQTTLHKMKNMKKNRDFRDAKIDLALEQHYELRNNQTTMAFIAGLGSAVPGRDGPS